MSRGHKSSRTSTIPWKELLAFLGVMLTAYITYLGMLSQTEIPIQATQTAEARLTNQAVIVPTDTSIVGLTSQPTSIIIMVATQSVTLTPIIFPITRTPTVVCITSRLSSGVPAEIQWDTFTYIPVVGSAGTKIALANGEVIHFRDMKGFEVIELTENPYRVLVTITMLDGETITDYVGSEQAYWHRLEGKTKRGTFSMELSDVKRVEFQEEGDCQ